MKPKIYKNLQFHAQLSNYTWVDVATFTVGTPFCHLTNIRRLLYTKRLPGSSVQAQQKRQHLTLHAKFYIAYSSRRCFDVFVGSLNLVSSDSMELVVAVSGKTKNQVCDYFEKLWQEAKPDREFEDSVRQLIRKG